MHAVRVTDLASPLRRPLREGDRTALTVAGTGKIRTGDLVVFCKPAAVAAAVIRRDGQVQAGGHPADHARLGLIEQQPDEMTGQPGTIDQVAAPARPQGKVKGTARRSMTMAAAVRAVMLMALMPEAGYGEILAALFGDLPLVPWHVPFAVPTETVLATWRDAVGPEPVLHLQDMVPGASAAEHQEHDYRAISIGDLHLGSIDGSVTRMPDTPANRAEFGSAGTSDDSAPNSSLRQVTNLSKEWSRAVLDVPIAAGEDLEQAAAVLRAAALGLADDAEWAALLLGEPIVAGVQSYEIGFVRVRITAATLPGRQFQVARELRLRCATALTEAGLAAPVMEMPGTTMGNP